MTRFKTICGFFWRIPSIKGTTVESASQISPSHHTTSRGPTKLHCDPPIDFWIQAVVSRHSQLSENMTQNLLKIPDIWDCWWTDDIRDCSIADLRMDKRWHTHTHTHTKHKCIALVPKQRHCGSLKTVESSAKEASTLIVELGIPKWELSNSRTLEWGIPWGKNDEPEKVWAAKIVKLAC